MFNIGKKNKARKVISGFSEILHEQAAEEGDVSITDEVLRWRDEEADVAVFFPEKDGDVGLLHTSTMLSEGMIEVRRIYFTHTGIISGMKILLTPEEARGMDHATYELYAETNYALDDGVSDEDMAHFFETLGKRIEK